MAHGNWVRDAVLFTPVRLLGFRLAELFQLIPGSKYPAAAAVKRFGQAQDVHPARKRCVEALRPTLGR